MNSDIKEITEFLVIDVDTSYNALLGRPWVHDHHIVPSTYHQCVKYSWIGRQGRIVADNDPFNGASAYYADARFHIKAVLPKDTEKEKEAVKGESSESSKGSDTPKKTFRYVPRSQRKELTTRGQTNLLIRFLR